MITAFALKEAIEKAEEQRKGGYESYQTVLQSATTRDITKQHEDAQKKAVTPPGAQRNICNSYMWTAEGGTAVLSNSTVETVHEEVGGNLSAREFTSFSLNTDVEVLSINLTNSVDTLSGAHSNIVKTKSVTSDTAFHLEATLPGSVDIGLKNRRGVGMVILLP